MTSPTDQYDSTIPQASDDLATSQGQFLTNFEQIYNAFLINHIPLDAASNAGNHTIIQLLSSMQPFQTDAGEISIYAKLLDTKAPPEDQAPQLFMRYQGNQTEVPITNYQLYSIPPTPQRTQYFTFLPGKILIYYGTVLLSGFPFNLSLNPGIGKNILTANFCTSFDSTIFTNNLSPIFDPVVSQDGIIRSIELKTFFLPGIPNTQKISYIVSVNI